MEVGVKVWVEDLKTGEVHHTNSSYLTFVALDDSGKPAPVPAAVPEDETEKRRWNEAGLRREQRLVLRAKALEHERQRAVDGE
jgi:acyl-CoA hydrolase